MRLRGFIWWWGPSISWAAALFGLSSIPARVYPRVSFTFADKLVHMAVYALLGWLCARSIRGASPGPFAWAVALAAFAIATGYGISDEFHQLFVAGRSADPRDVIADAVGAALGVGAFALAARWRNSVSLTRAAKRVD